MKIAIPADEKSLASNVCVSFGRTPYFLIYDADMKESVFLDNSAAAGTGGAGIKAAQTIVDNKANTALTNSTNAVAISNNAMAQVTSTTARQTDLENTFKGLTINAGNSNAEIVAGRYDNVNNKLYDYIPDRLDNFSSQLNDNTQQLSFVDRLKAKFVYGFKGDGTNETDKFYNAINDLYNKGSGSLYLPNGVYCVDWLYLLDGVNLISEENAIIKRTKWSGDVPGGAGEFVYLLGMKDIVIDGIIFDANAEYVGTNTPSHRTGGDNCFAVGRGGRTSGNNGALPTIALRDSTVLAENIKIKNCTVRGFKYDDSVMGGRAITSHPGCKNIYFTNNTIEDCSYGLDAQAYTGANNSTTDIFYLHNTVINCERAGFNAYRGEALAGFDYSLSVMSVYLDGNTFINCGTLTGFAPITFDRATGIKASGTNTIFNDTSHSIETVFRGACGNSNLNGFVVNVINPISSVYNFTPLAGANTSVFDFRSIVGNNIFNVITDYFLKSETGSRLNNMCFSPTNFVNGTINVAVGNAYTNTLSCLLDLVYNGKRLIGNNPSVMSKDQNELFLNDVVNLGYLNFTSGSSTAIVKPNGKTDLSLQCSVGENILLTSAGTKINNSNWDGRHLLLGSWHIWIDASGRLRMKASAPTTESDGVIIGTQS
jgi:predicted Fe-Mo cluster-binding NifX family protein